MMKCKEMEGCEGEKCVKRFNLEEKRVLKEGDLEFFKEFERQFGVDYCPVFSVLGSVVC